MAARFPEAMQHDIFFAIWFFLPAGAANVAPILAAKVPYLKRFDTPIDAGRTFRGKRVLGDHKTWRGLVSGILAATLVLGIQQLCVVANPGVASATATVDYAHLNALLFGPLFALGALGGDAVKSFFKRQRGIPSGHSWLPFDQLDYIVGAAVATFPFLSLPLEQYLWAVAFWLGMHLLASLIGFWLGFKERPI